MRRRGYGAGDRKPSELAPPLIMRRIEPTEKQLAERTARREGEAISEIGAALEPLDRAARDRVLRWAADRYAPSETPPTTREAPPPPPPAPFNPGGLVG
jgi:hypothetical protein